MSLDTIKKNIDNIYNQINDHICYYTGFSNILLNKDKYFHLTDPYTNEPLYFLGFSRLSGGDVYVMLEWKNSRGSSENSLEKKEYHLQPLNSFHPSHLLDAIKNCVKGS